MNRPVGMRKKYFFEKLSYFMAYVLTNAINKAKKLNKMRKLSDEVDTYKEDIHWLDYKPGGENKYGEEITRLLGRSSKAIVYLILTDGHEKLKCHWDPKACPNGTISNAIAHELLMQIETGINKQEFKNIGRDLVGTALFKAYEIGQSEEKTDHFSTAREYIETKMFERAHFRYLLASFYSVLVFILFTVLGLMYTPLNNFGNQLILSGGIATVGAFVSVIQRYKDIDIQRYTSTSYLAIGAITRILLGFIFGMVFILALKSELIFATLESNVFAVYLLSFISGINERFIPEILKRVETVTSEDKEGETTHVSNT